MSTAAQVLPIATEIVRPDYRGAEPLPFAAEITVSGQLAAYDRLAAFLGRSPQWSS